MDIVMVGACYLDTILTVPYYPQEDTKLRASHIETRRGGNCANSLEVLQQLIVRHDDDNVNDNGNSRRRHRLHLISCLPRRDSPAAQKVVQSFGDNSLVSFQHCTYREAATEAPSSYIIRSQQSGSRTLVNYSALDEMTVEEFEAIALAFSAEEESWWHFEGRIPETTLKCIHLLRQILPKAKISVEVEKPGRRGLRELAAEADVVFYSKAWAEAAGYDSAAACLATEPRGQAFLSLCPWGAGGAYAVSHISGDQIHYPVQQPSQEITVVDSIGAGDTFIAGMLYGLAYHSSSSSSSSSIGDSDWDTRRCVRFAVDLASLKVQREGFAGLGDDLLVVHAQKRRHVTAA